jgi:transposase
MEKKKRCYSAEEKEAWIQFKQEKSKKNRKEGSFKVMLKDIPNAPSLRSIERWELQKQQGQNLENNLSKRGRKAKLTAIEQAVVFGKVIFREREEKVTSAQTIKQFIKKAFNEDVSKSWISSTLKAHGITSQKVRTDKANIPLNQRISEIKKFISDVRDEIAGSLELS